MSDQKNSRQGFLKEKMGAYHVNPPDHVWDSIVTQLGGRGRRRMIILTLSAAASIALAVTLGITFLGPQIDKGKSIAETTDPGSVTPIEEHGNTLNLQAQPGGKDVEQESFEELAQGRQEGTLEEKVIRSLQEFNNEGLDVVSETIVPKEAVDLDAMPEQIAEAENPFVVPEDSPSEMEPRIAELKAPEIPVPDPDENLALEDLSADPLPEILDEQKGDPRWIVGAALSPLYSFRDAESNAMAGATDFESGMIAYAGGVHVSYRAANRLAIETGIFYNKMGISIGAPGIQSFNNVLDFTPLAQEGQRTSVMTITNSIGNIVATSGEIYVNNYKLNASSEANAFTDYTNGEIYASDQGIRQHLDYLELPFNLRYTVVDRTFELQLVGGISTNFLVNNYVTMETSSGTNEIGYLTNIRSVNYSGNAGLGMVYHLHEKISLRLEPRFRYFLNSVNDASLPTTRPFAIGLYTGLNYTF